MKNIFDILSGVGLTVPEDKKADFESAFNENYKTVNDYIKVKTARDNFKSQLDTATETLISDGFYIISSPEWDNIFTYYDVTTFLSK